METLRFDIVEELDSPEAISIYLSEALETNDPAYIAHALGNIAKARGMTQIARDSGLGRESLYKALSGTRNPEFGTILRVIQALGLKLQAVPAAA